MKSKMNNKKTRHINTFIRTICILIMTVGLVSCSNDDDAPPKEESVRVKSYTVNGRESQFSYDDNGRLTKHGNKIINYDGEGRIIQHGNVTFEYNSQGLVSKRIESLPSVNMTTTYTYDNNRLVSSVTNWKFSDNSTTTILNTYEYDEKNRLAVMIINHPRNGYRKTKLKYDQNDNIVQKFVEHSNNGADYEGLAVTNYTYDNKNSPNYNALLKAGIQNPINSYHIMRSMNVSIEDARLYYYSKNNLLSHEGTHLRAGSTSSREYEYVYDENDYPISVEINAINSDGTGWTESHQWAYEPVN